VAVVSLVVAILVLIPFSLRWQAQWQLDAYRKKLIAAGEKLTVEELAPKRTTQGTNTAAFLRLASSLRDSGWYQPDAMHSIKPGVARVAWREERLMQEVDLTKPDTNIWPGLMGVFRTNEAPLDELQQLVDEGNIEMGFNDTQNNLHFTSLRKAILGIVSEAILALHQGEMRQAFRAVTSCGDVSQLIARNPSMIDQAVTYSFLSVATTTYWEALQTSGWTDSQLSRWQQQWEQVNVLGALDSTLAMERALAPRQYQLARASRQGYENINSGAGVKDFAEIWNDFLERARSAPGELLQSYPRYWGWSWIWSFSDEQQYLETMQNLIETARDARMRSRMLSQSTDQNGRTGDPKAMHNLDLSAGLSHNYDRFFKNAIRTQTVANMVATAIALERFRLAHHAYPDDLAKLIPEFIKALPVDCMDGRNLRYRLNPDSSYLLYSAGEDGVDDGGDATPPKDRSLSFFLGRDLVWPRAATAEEMQGYEAEKSLKAAKHK